MDSLSLSQINSSDASSTLPQSSITTFDSYSTSSQIGGQTTQDKARASTMISFASLIKSPSGQAQTTGIPSVPQVVDPYLGMTGTEIEIQQAKERAKGLQLGVKGEATTTSARR